MGAERGMLRTQPTRCRMSRFAVFLPLFIVAPLSAASTDPREVVTRLYAVVQAPASDDAAIAPLLGDALRSAVEAQRAYERACTTLAAPDEKPHMLDQSPYLMAPDRPQTVSVGMPGSTGNATWVPVDLAVVTIAGPTGSCCSGRARTGRSWRSAGAGRQPDRSAAGVLRVPLHAFAQLAPGGTRRLEFSLPE